MRAIGDEPTNVLLIEDNPTDVRLVQELLRGAPNDLFNIITASTLAQGLEHLSSDHIDVILLDLGLPDSQGLDTFRAVYEHASHLPIIILTISDDETLGHHAVREGAQRFLSKDVLTLGAPYAGVFTRMIRFTIEQKHTESTLKTSEEQLRARFEVSPIAQIQYDAEGRPTRINAQCRALIGITDITDIQHLTIFTSPRVSERDKERLHEGHPVRYEQVYDFEEIKQHNYFPTTQSGTRYVDFFLTPLLDSVTGGVKGYFGDLVDITERKRAEEALQESHKEVQMLNEELEHRVQERTEELASMNEELQVSNEELRHETEERTRAEEQARTASLYARSLIEASIDPLVTFNAEGRITDVNKATEEVTGYSRDELIGSDFSDYFTEPAQAKAGYEQVFESGFVTDYPLTLRDRSGKMTDVLYNATVYRNEAGDIQGVFAAARDVTELRRAEEALKESEARYRSLVERNFDGVIIHSDGIIRYANDAAARISRVSSPDELIGMSAFELSTPEYRELMKQRVQEIYRTHESSDLIEIQMNTPDGTTVDIELSGTLITYEGKPAIYVVARDISERKQMEAQLKQYADQLEDLVEERTAQLKYAERLAAIGQTAAMIGHDLRNPLQGLQYIVDLQNLRFDRIPPEKRGAEDWEKEQALFDRISEQVFYMDKIVGDLQDYARPLNPEREALSVRTLIDDVLQSLPHADNNVEVNAALPDLIVQAEPHLMHRMFANLILNALQAMPDGGTLTIDATAADDLVAISVRDTGVGIPHEMRDKLFSPLTTGKAKGTGLGLAVVKRIVVAHGGTITFESEEGKGTTFTVTVPTHP